MLSRLFRIIVLSVIAFGVTPFTAPFSTCDWGTSADRNQRNQPSSHQAAPTALIKTSIDPDKAPVVAAIATLTTPLFRVVANDIAARIPRGSSQRVLLLTLRI
jgi:hypothetical protein